MQKMIAIASATLLSVAAAGSALADDRPATGAERAQIGSILSANGFSSWKKIEYDRDDRKFEVDDARHANGRVYDVDIRNGRIIKKDRE